MEIVSKSWQRHVPVTCQGRFWELALDHIYLANYHGDYLIRAFRHSQWPHRSDLSISYPPHALTYSTPCEICAQFCFALVCCGYIVNISGYMRLIQPRSTLKLKCHFGEIFITGCIEISVKPVMKISFKWQFRFSVLCCPPYRDDAIIYKHFPRYWPFVMGIYTDQMLGKQFV